LSAVELILTGRSLGLRFRLSRPSRGRRWLGRIAARRAAPLARLIAEAGAG
jgi:hypothetical protein